MRGASGWQAETPERNGRKVERNARGEDARGGGKGKGSGGSSPDYAMVDLEDPDARGGGPAGSMSDEQKRRCCCCFWVWCVCFICVWN